MCALPNVMASIRAWRASALLYGNCIVWRKKILPPHGRVIIFSTIESTQPLFYWMHIFHSGNYHSTQSQSAQAEAVIFRCIVHSTSQFQIFCCQLGSMFVQIYPIFLWGTYFWVPAIDLHCMTTGR